jgi:hypothetical protein
MNKLMIKRDNITGIVLFVLGLIGFINTLIGEFSGGEGIGAHFFPQITFVLMMLSSGIMVFEKSDELKKDYIAVTPLPVGIFLALGALYFVLLLRWGLIVSTLIYLIGSYGLLTPQPHKHIRVVLIPTAIVLVIIYVLFRLIVGLVI